MSRRPLRSMQRYGRFCASERGHSLRASSLCLTPALPSDNLAAHESPGQAIIAGPAGFFLCRGTKMPESPAREEIARRYGFDTYADLMNVSEEMPWRPRTYIARRPDGGWFVWDDPTPPLSRDDEWDG